MDELNGLGDNRSYAEALRDLRLAGFVAEDAGLSPLTGKPIKQPRFRIKGNSARCYLENIEPRSAAIKAMDWLELYNPGATPAGLTGWRVTDTVEDVWSERKKIPAGTTILASGVGEAICRMNLACGAM